MSLPHVRAPLERCTECNYYVCTCTKEKVGSCPQTLLQPSIGPGALHKARHGTRSTNLESCDFLHGPVLGIGTCGSVRLVRHKRSGAYYALKSLRKERLVSLRQESHAASEVQILRSLCYLETHPFIMTMFDHFHDLELLHLLLEFCAGGDLLGEMRRAGRLTVSETKFYLAEVVLALEVLHRKCVVHRSVQPENVLLTQHGHIKLGGFTFACVVETRTYTVCGTPSYLAPEILNGEGYGSSVDWWSLGVMAFEALVGVTPFRGDGVECFDEIVDGGNIVKARVPCGLDSKAKALICALLRPSLHERLTGAKAVKMDQFFRFLRSERLSWDKLLRGAVSPPRVPNLAGDDDTAAFDHLPDIDGGANATIAPESTLLVSASVFGRGLLHEDPSIVSFEEIR